MGKGRRQKAKGKRQKAKGKGQRAKGKGQRAAGMNRRVVVNDRMQRGYVYYLTEPVGRNFPPEFRPDLTPKQMLALGVFGGKYMTDCRNEFPASWFARARLCATH